MSSLSSAVADAAADTATPTVRPGPWLWLSNHAYVLLCIHDNADVKLSEIADTVGITERAVQRIVSELTAEGVISREKVGRRNRYTITRTDARHPLDRLLGALIESHT